MKPMHIALGLLVLPGVTFAGGAGNLSLYNTNNASQAQAAPSANLGSSENPVSILESRDASDAGDASFLRYSFGYIPNSFWASYSGNLEDINGFIEAEEYFGETRRTDYTVGEDLDRQNERQNRAQNKAMRLRFIGQ